mmetsp:Transcript_26013/g.63543  ORF Transcript_26013/g.63543 Transcript_26013/m.63543 type:complete len:290 (+) Transcript_26013:91-960(+)
MRLPLHLAIASIALDPITCLSYMESLGRENFSQPSSNESSHLDSQPQIPHPEVSYHAGTNQRSEMTTQQAELSLGIKTMSTEFTSSGDKNVALPDYRRPDSQPMSRLQDESIFPSHTADGKSTAPYLDSISRSEEPSTPDTVDASFSAAFSPEGGSVSRSENESPSECVVVDGEMSPYCDGLGGVASSVAISRQKWAGTSGYLDSLSRLRTETPVNMPSTTLRIETRSSTQSREGQIGADSERQASIRRSTLTFTIPAENVAELVRQLKEKGGTLRLTGSMEDLSFEHF